MGTVFTNGPGDQSSIPSQVIPKTQKMELEVSISNIEYYKVRKKGEWCSPRKGDEAFPKPRYSNFEKGAFGLPSIMVSQLTYIIMCV